MDKQIQNDQTDTNQDIQTLPNTSIAPEHIQPQHKHRKFTLTHIILPRWALIALVVIVGVGLISTCFVLYKKVDDLNQQNKNLNITLEDYKKVNAKPEKLADVTLLPITNEDPKNTVPAPAPSESGSFGGKAVQVNSAEPDITSPKFDGGEYAPFWFLTKFALTIPEGTKMVRTTDVSTNGHLLKVDNEGGAGCGGEGIYMSVGSMVSVPGGAFRASGSSATYSRDLGCGTEYMTKVVYTKYYAMPKASQYKYVELVAVDCVEQDTDNNCIDTNVDKTKWRLYSGIVLKEATEYKAGDDLETSIILRQLYNRTEYGAQFHIDCSDDGYSSFSCDAKSYKNNDYKVALNDSNYIHIKNIVIDMHEH